MSRTDLRAGVFKDTRNEWHRSSPEEDGDANQAEFLEQDTGIQRQDQGLIAPIAQGTGDEWTVNAATVDGWILQPPTNSAFAALRERGTGVNVREPGRDGTTLGEQQARDHPSQGVGVADVIPQSTLEVGEDGLIESGRIPGGVFGCHR